MEIATQALLAELRRASVPYQRLDTSDPTDALANRGTWTFHNATLACAHLFKAVRRIARRDVHAVYVPIAQEFPALLRDLAFLGIARLARKPAAVHLHGGDFERFYRSRSRPVRWFIRSIIGGAAVGIVLTDRLRPALECVLPRQRVAVVPNGLDLPENSEEKPRVDDGLTVIFLSSLYPSKGVLVFLEALAAARERHADLRGVVAGSWPTADARETALALTDELSLDDHVRFVGPVSGGEKTAVLRGGDVFCFPSFYPLEGQPLVVIEAMAAGLPVVATAWRGIADTVVDRETGFLVDEPSPQLVADKLVYLAENPEARTRMGAAGRARYERLYTQRAFGERIVPVLRALLEARESRSSSLADEPVR
jgi:glycosyltransferase involved in cell wall biosynthesis